MRAIVAGVDYAPRPHMVSFFARALKRLGADVSVVSAEGASDRGSYTDPCFVEPRVRIGHVNGGRVGLSDVVRACGPADFVLMVDCGNNWAVMNDGSAPYAYVWREGNRDEEGRVHSASAGAPVFVSMVGKGAAWPSNSRFMPFAVDCEVFSGGPRFDARPFDIVYTGRERGRGTWARLQARLNARCTDYVDGYHVYASLLAQAKTTYAVDGGRYVASRGIEAMAKGCAVFWDGGEAVDRAGFEPQVHYVPLQWETDGATGERVPAPGFEDEVKALCGDKGAWLRLSVSARHAILQGHTYEHRLQTIATALGVKL